MMNPFKFFALVYLLVLVLIILPVVIAILPFWWVVAWVFGKVFPGRDFSLSRRFAPRCGNFSLSVSNDIV